MATIQKNRRTVATLVFSCVFMFGFGFALVPLYDVFCRVTGLNGKVELVPTQPSGLVDNSRQIKLQLVAINNETMPWQFQPQITQVELSPGEMYQTAYLARNLTQTFMIAQAVPSVSPSEAAPYLQKINCFCFERQPLEASEEKNMPLVLSVDPELPEHIHTITLSYTLFDITPDREAVVALRGGSQL
ncbi:cytochrome c oxidase assembly protein [Neptuniibacter sp.]|uniref:cytochrome c oxidase assembly protein n=1 Tax=Neptuniibacter sp. TaxID=1962643 RepID=UPI0026205E31|nr:cytochrome c oxidase assembly protein [Neptuniibacter sp.]MCP4597466.1 cytochrome c oxidase assembly protein [Neptuniibacter sp.]